jgi:ubiquinone/menaquinone biosynthesis C-methylase UbiE
MAGARTPGYARSMSDVNAEAIEAWNTVLFDKFVRFRHLLTDGLRVHGRAALARLSPGPEHAVVDLGCGFGDSTLEIARQAASVVGVDAAARFIDAARREAESAAVANARFEVRDVQTEALGGPYDLAYARFGTMFFQNPVAAMRNVSRALTDGGRLCMVVWRRREDNPWLHEAELTVRALVEENHDSDAPTCGPGPFSMADADVVSTVLAHAGFERIGLERHDADICIGHSLDEAVEFALALGPAGEILRLAGDEGERRRPEVARALRDTLARYLRDDAVWAPSSTWLITAAARR